MRCARCGRRGTIRRASRTPSGRLAFDWCEGCLAEVELVALGVPVVSRLGHDDDPPRRPLLEDVDLAASRSRGLVALATVFAAWGLILGLVGLAQSLSVRPFDVGRTPLGLTRARLLATGGAGVSLVALGAAVSAMGSELRRVTLLRMIRNGFWAFGGALSLLLVAGWLPFTLAFGLIGSLGVALGFAAHFVEGLVPLPNPDLGEWKEELLSLSIRSS